MKRILNRLLLIWLGLMLLPITLIFLYEHKYNRSRGSINLANAVKELWNQ